jgi:DNA-binding NarL/FixJ family response regulator
MSVRTALLIAHPKALIRAGLRAMLVKTGIAVVGEADDGRTALALTRKLRPGVLLVDVGVVDGSGMDGFELLAKVRETSPGTKLIGMSAVENPTYMARAIAAGVSDFLCEDVTGQQLVTAIEHAAVGKAPSGTGPFASVVASLSKATQRNRAAESAGIVPLSPREMQVLSHIGYGLSNDEIARALGISVETVKEHVQGILRKLAVKDRTQAAVWAVRSGVV